MPSIKEILTAHTEDPQKLMNVLCVDSNETREQDIYKEEYEGTRTRRIKSVGHRPDKTIDIKNASGEKTGEKTIHVAKLVLPFPEEIVDTRVHFSFGGKMNISSADNEDVIKDFADVWVKGLKMQNALKKMARTCMIETKAAMVFYTQKVFDGDAVKALKLRVQVLDSESGEFYPHFDDYGDMDAFIRTYSTVDVEGKTVNRGIIYTADQILELVNDSGWEHKEGRKNKFGKIPVVYVEQDLPEWESIAPLMDAYEMRLSRLADTNDYFAEPLLKLYGNISKAPSKEEVGKLIQFEMKRDVDGKISHGDAEYATWDHIPESTKLEMESVREGIYFIEGICVYFKI